VRLTLMFVVVAMASVTAQQAAQAPDQTDDAASLTRVAGALANPPSKLVLQERKPDFTVDIRERERFEHLLPPMWEFKTGPVLWASPAGWSQPLFTVDLLAIAGAIAKSVASARRAHAEGAARDEVRREIANYCAAQPNAGAGLQICATSPAIR
jgi:hypothetical protein